LHEQVSSSMDDLKWF